MLKLELFLVISQSEKGKNQHNYIELRNGYNR